MVVSYDMSVNIENLREKSLENAVIDYLDIYGLDCMDLDAQYEVYLNGSPGGEMHSLVICNDSPGNQYDFSKKLFFDSIKKSHHNMFYDDLRMGTYNRDFDPNEPLESMFMFARQNPLEVVCVFFGSKEYNKGD